VWSRARPPPRAGRDPPATQNKSSNMIDTGQPTPRCTSSSRGLSSHPCLLASLCTISVRSRMLGTTTASSPLRLGRSYYVLEFERQIASQINPLYFLSGTRSSLGASSGHQRSKPCRFAGVMDMSTAAVIGRYVMSSTVDVRASLVQSSRVIREK
jgi:hypothetical protein